ncbi:MAG: cytochrome B [Methylophilales bacterium RIFCSPHIGHO2_02_FULL_57_10]|nr:MAG: cytochrome B [Methylophilales bacterium RIFCSPHIGHO2_02_FULL_57_10]
MSDTIQKYSKPAIILHWVTGLMILGMFGLGWYMADLPKEMPKTATMDLFDLGVYTMQFAEAITPRTFYFNLHKSLGVTVFLLLLLRIYIRVKQSPPPFPTSMKEWEKKLADIVHKALYVLTMAVPLSGITMAIYSKYGIKWFGLSLVAGLDNPELRDIFKETHEVIGAILITLIVLHIVAAIKHKVIDKDNVMQRMSL